MEGNSSSFASGNRGDASDHPEGMSKQAPKILGASGHPKIKTIKSLPRVVETKELPRKMPKIIKIEGEVGEVIIDEVEKDVRVRIKDVIIKIVYNSSGLIILVDDEIVYEARGRQ